MYYPGKLFKQILIQQPWHCGGWLALERDREQEVETAKADQKMMR